MPLATAERAVSIRFCAGGDALHAGRDASYDARQPSAAIPPLEAAIRIYPTSRTALGLLDYAYATSGDLNAARRMRACLESMASGPGSDIAMARIALGMKDTTEALGLLERAARARDPFFATESASSPIFGAIRGSARYAALLRSVGVVPPRTVASR